jgi:hypothetical protein
MEAGSNKSTMNYKVVQNNLLNSRKGLTTRRRSIYMANNHGVDNTVFQGNISAPVNQGEISANQGEISAMKKKKTKTASNPVKYPGERLHIDANEPLPLPMGRKEYWLKIRDEYSVYSWDYFMAEKSSATAILKRQLQLMKASGMRVKTVRCDNAKEQMAPLKDMCWANGVLVEY